MLRRLLSPRVGRSFSITGVLLATALTCQLGSAIAQPEATPPQTAPPVATEKSATSLAMPRGQALSLPDVLSTAVRQNPGLAQARIDVAIALAQVQQAEGIEDLVLSADANYFRRRAKGVAGDVIGTDKSDTGTLALALSKLLPTGGVLSLGGEIARTEAQYVGQADTTTVYEANTTARLAQPLLRGFGSSVTLANEEIARIQADAQTLTLAANVQTVVRDLIGSYWEMVYAHSDWEIRQASFDLAKERRRLTEAAVKLGSVAPTELLAVDQVLAQREEEILAAEVSVTQRSLELRQSSGMPITGANNDVAPVGQLIANPQSFNVEAELAKVYITSPELKQLAEQGKRAQIDLMVTENGILPRLDLTVAGGPLGTGGTAGDAIDNMAKFNGHFIEGGLHFEMPLSNNQARGARLIARHAREKVKFSEIDVKAQLASALVQAAKLAESAAKRITISQTAITLSEKNVQAETARFNLGKATNFDVLQRQDELKQARLRNARAMVDYLKAEASIQALTGEILPKYGISVELPK